MDRRDELRRGLDLTWTAIGSACARAGRSADDVRLIAVSKFKPAEDIRIAHELGQRDFGENYVQSLLAKQAELRDLPDLRWHLIGHLQRNKARQVAESGACIHTLDDARLAAELNKRASGAQCSLDVFVQVNLRGEPQKAGCSPEAVPDLVELITSCTHLVLVGLMAVPPNSDDSDDVRGNFAALRQLAAQQTLPLARLSMGMSRDFEIAIEEGATDVRVGSAIFGERG